ncbi:MAG: hypothetical protein K1060chlam1_00980 [Candidatus Anoxychlamydiales bacterium]|nr:hypothetical protein [Candidatus Anoxychlamydiales bacterium]
MNFSFSNAISRWPKDLLPGFINGGVFVREKIIDAVPFLNSKKGDSKVETAVKTIVNLFIIRGSSLAFNTYNWTSLTYLAKPSNALFAGYKTIRAINCYRKGARYEGNRKLLEAAAHVALFGIDCFVIWPLMPQYQFDAVGIIYMVTGVAMDISRTSKELHNRLFPSKQEISDRRRLDSEGFSSDYDELSAEFSDDDMDEYSSDGSDSDYREARAEEAEDGAPRDALGYGAPPAEESSEDGIGRELGYMPEGDDYSDGEELISEDEDPPVYPGSSYSSPIGAYERRSVEEARNDPRFEDSCKSRRRTTGGMQLRDENAMKPPIIFSP